MSTKKSWGSNIVTKLDALKSWQVACIILAIGFTVFFSGLSGGFQGDDNLQIVDNLAVHNIKNLPHFFTSSTFWNGESLVGSFYRPMMTTTFAFIYSIFGANPIGFHVVQLLLYMAAAFVLYLFLKTFFKPGLALVVVLIFLVHPINSQVVMAIPSMQEPLFFLFGILALYTLSRSQTNKSFIIAALFLLLSMLSKETGIVFAALSLLYLGLFKRQRIIAFLAVAAIPAIIYVLLRENALGFLPSTIHAAPISTLGFGERMLTVPSILAFYVSQFLFPSDLATSYYWTHAAFDIQNVLIPLFFVALVVGGLVYLGRLVQKRGETGDARLYVFFASWAALGLLPYLQIIPLDMTACETWFFASIPGFLGLIATALKVLVPKSRVKWIYIAAVPIVIALGARTFVRGFDYTSQYTLASKDVSVTKGNYLAMNNLAQSLMQMNKYDQALTYVQDSIGVYPAVTNYTNLGVIKQKRSDFAGARVAYEKALEYGSLAITYENLGIVNLTIGDRSENITYFKKALDAYSRNNRLWTYLALQYAENGNSEEAKKAIKTAAALAPVPQQLYYAIMAEQTFDITLPGSSRVIHLP